MSEEKISFFKRFKFWIVGIVAVGVLAAIGVVAQKGKTTIGTPSEIASKSTAAATGPDGKELLPIRTPTRKDCTLAPLLVADKKGFFAEEGIKLVFTGELQPGQLLPSIVNGDNDLGDAHPNYLAISRAGGARVTAVARSIIEPGSEMDPKLRHMRWFVNPQAGITKFAQLKEYKGEQKLSITGMKNSCAEFLANKIADSKGVPRDKFEFLVMKDIQAVQAVKQGNLDVAGVHPPFYKAAEDAGLVQIADSLESGLGESAGVFLYYFSEDFIKKNPDTVSRFVRAITKAQTWANANLEQTAKWTEEFIGVPVTGNHYYSSTTKINEAQIKPWLEDMEKYGVVEPGKVKLSELVTHKFEQ